MTEERLKEIKVSLDFQTTATKAYGYDETLLNEELELYNEVVRLREIIDKTKEYIENNTLYTEDYDYDEDDNLRWQGAYDYKAREDLLDILKQNNLTLEQLTGVDNA